MSRQGRDASERYFGAVCLGLGLVSAWIVYRVAESLPGAVTCMVLGLIAALVYYAFPAIRSGMFRSFQTLTFPVRWLVTLLALAAVYFFVVTPIAIWYRWRGKSIVRDGGDVGTNWREPDFSSDPESYFRTF